MVETSFSSPVTRKNHSRSSPRILSPVDHHRVVGQLLGHPVFEHLAQVVELVR